MYNLFISLFLILSIGFSATLSGTVNYGGKNKKAKILTSIDSDPICAAEHKDVPPISESLIMDEKNNLKNVLVWLEGVKYDGETPKEPAVIDQIGCVYIPHVQGIMKNQEVIIKNSDKTMHNVNAQAKENMAFNFAMPVVVKEKKVVFDKVEDPFYIKCDVHSWMKSWVGVFDHPYFATTDDNGNYKIENVPPGTYNVVFWHEKFSNLKKKYVQISHEKSIEVSDDAHTLDYTFPKPKKK